MADGRLHVPYLSQCYDALVGATFNLIWFCRVCTYFDIEKVGPVEVKLIPTYSDDRCERQNVLISDSG